MTDNNLSKLMITQVYEEMFSLLSFFPGEYLEKLKLASVSDAYLKAGKKALAIDCTLFFPFVLQKEKKRLDRTVLKDIMLLQTLLFYAYGLYDAVHDRNRTAALPCGNVLFKEALLLAGKYGVRLSDAVNRIEQYNQDPLVIRPGKLEMARVKEYDDNWLDLRKGFAIGPELVKEVMRCLLPGCRKDWARFFENYLIYNQIQDDVNDFTQDYKHHELKSFGIFGLAKRFYKYRVINLGNPFTSFRFELYILGNIESLYEEFLNRFWESLGGEGEQKDFKRTLEELKKGVSNNTLFEDA